MTEETFPGEGIGSYMWTHRTEELARPGLTSEGPTSCFSTQEKGHRQKASLNPTQVPGTHAPLSLACPQPPHELGPVHAGLESGKYLAGPPFPLYDCLGLQGYQQGPFLWTGNVCGSCGHCRLSLHPSEVEATFLKVLNSSSNLLLLSGHAS
jgi:hypothetical protein